MPDIKRDAEVITLGSGNLLCKEYADAMPAYTDFDDDTDLLGRIQGGATLEYKGAWYEAKDDTGKVVKTIITDEEATLKSGILTWNGKTLEKLCSTAVPLFSPLTSSSSCAPSSSDGGSRVFPHICNIKSFSQRRCFL